MRASIFVTLLPPLCDTQTALLKSTPIMRGPLGTETPNIDWQVSLLTFCTHCAPMPANQGLPSTSIDMP